MPVRKSGLALILGVAGTFLLAACAETPKPATVGGLGEVFHDPGFAVRGKTNKDQRWISETQEAGIRVLGWKRPAKLKTPKIVKVKATPKPKPQESKPIYPPVLETTPSPELTPSPRRHWWQR